MVKTQKNKNYIAKNPKIRILKVKTKKPKIENCKDENPKVKKI